MEYQICPKCDANNSKCPKCGGSGQVMNLNGHLYAWQDILSWRLIHIRRIWRLIKHTIDGVLLALMLFGFIAAGFFIYANSPKELVDIYKFFLNPTPLSSFFWITLLIGFYLYYRIASTKSAEETINYKRISKSKASPKRVRGTQEFFTAQAHKIIHQAYLVALRYKQPVTAAHILLVLINYAQIIRCFERLSLDILDLNQRLKKHLNKLPKKNLTYLSREARFVLNQAFLTSLGSARNHIEPEELLLAICSFTNPAQEMLFELEIDKQKITHTIEWLRLKQKVGSYWSRLRAGASHKPKGPVNRAYTSLASPLLDQFSQDLTQLARQGRIEPVLGCEKIVDQVLKGFASTKKGVLIIGEPGTGKTASLDYLSELMAAEKVPKFFQDKRLVKISISGLVAGAGAPGAIEKRLLDVLREVAQAGNIILCMDRLEDLVGLRTESAASFDVAGMLAQELEKNYFVLIATTTQESYEQHIKNSSLDQVLAKVNIPPMNIENSIRALSVKSLLYEKMFGLFFAYQALEKAVILSHKLMPNQNLPGVAVEILEKTAKHIAQGAAHAKRRVVLGEHVAQVVSKVTKIPVTKVGLQESEELLHLEETMHQRIVGQHEAVKEVANALRRSRAKMKDAKRPIASFLFLGPTGVGKTEIARVLADIYFGGQKNIIRLDMSEYGAQDGVQKLIGYAGATQSGYLIKQLTQKPFSLLLLDELEKASPDVHNLFLQVMEDGRLTDNLGKTYDFTNTIIIGTSNASSIFIQQQVKDRAPIEKIKEAILNEELVKYFKPEFINRFDAVTVFRPLTQSQVEQITKLLLDELKPNLHDKGFGFVYSDLAVTQVAQAGFDPKYGARPLRRVIQDRIENKIAEIILSGQIKRRDTIILKTIDQIEVKKAPEL